MIKKLLDSAVWLPEYLRRGIRKRLYCIGASSEPVHIFFCICDHFEPYCAGADKKTARNRINRWIVEYPKIADRFTDSDGKILKYSFFYPEEEYKHDDMKALADLCQAGYGEVEIHLHHDNDTSDNLRRTLIEYKKRLHGEHGLLPVDRQTGEVSYGFIHGNWALDNSRRDRRWCGVNDELSILLETGCYADFTMPSAPSDTQTRKINSIYRAIDDPQKPKSHNWGADVAFGKKGKGLLMIQGPLCLDWSKKKFFILPGIENSGLYSSNPPTANRVKNWVSAAVHVAGFPQAVFVKVYTHGAQDDISKMLLDEGGLSDLLSALLDKATVNRLHFLSAREMANVVLAIEEGATSYTPGLRDYRLRISRIDTKDAGGLMG